jgi:D-serine deaminase-like pyridoxal phosphate-dependent protein
LSDRSRSWMEIERILAREVINGALSREDLPTPALLLDLDAFEANIHKMISHVQKHKKALRPHGKAHKCPEIAKLLIRAGAVGACVAKISEAEVFARNGVSGLLITTPVIGKHKIERALTLATARPDTIFCVDDAQNIQDLNNAADSSRALFNLAVDLRVGGRTGVRPGEPALALANLIDSLPYVRFVGLQAYAGPAAQMVGWEQRSKASHEAMEAAVATRCLLQEKGIDVPLLTGGSTGTYDIDSEIEGITELQPGSFMFMDLAYRRIGGKLCPDYQDFQNALSVSATIISKPTSDLAIVDAGFKAFSTDQPLTPKTKTIGNVTYSWAGDEHGFLSLSNSALSLGVGDIIEFLIPHCDPTVNLYDRIFCLRGDRVERVWTVAARGKSQ